MTFEDNFPSLKGKANYVMTPQCPRAVELVGNPSEEVRLAWQGKQVVITKWIEEHCLDKQKVREAIRKVVEEYQEHEELDFQDPKKQEWTPIYWINRLNEELGL